jgi:hypothetical protein
MDGIMGVSKHSPSTPSFQYSITPLFQMHPGRNKTDLNAFSDFME